MELWQEFYAFYHCYFRGYLFVLNTGSFLKINIYLYLINQKYSQQLLA